MNRVLSWRPPQRFTAQPEVVDDDDDESLDQMSPQKQLKH